MKCVFIVLGATGDLARRKLLPAIYKLLSEKKLKNFLIIGAALDEISSTIFLNQAKKFIQHCDDVLWKKIQKHTYYRQLNFENKNDFISLNDYVSSLEKEYNIYGCRLVYIAASADFFCTITDHCANSGLVKKSSTENEWHRIVYEKPFGHDFISAKKINECIKRSFHESQIFRIDHYLTKEIVSNISMIRFANCVFEPLWNNRFIDNVQVVLSEKLCIEGRGTYYDKYGALCDVVQNHILELIALIGMEAPENLLGDAVREKRARVIEKLDVVDGLLGQYEHYHQENGVHENSKTETFAALMFRIENERWKGVPFFIRTGKCLDKKETRIQIKFKQVDCLLTKGCPMESNHLTIEIDPESAFSLRLNAKNPKTVDSLVPVEMNFCHSCEFAAVTPEAYEVIFEEVIRGETSVSVRFDEIEYAWHVIDSIKSMQLPLYRYKKGSKGPEELLFFAKKHGVRWLS